MKLLIITQKIDADDDVLGFMHGWIAEFAKHCEEVIAIGLFVGRYEFPSNVRVISLGKESGVSRGTYLRNFFRTIWHERAHYDAVFVHMNQVYVLLGGMFWKLMGKKVGLWYAHGHSPISLKIALQFTDIVFTSTQSGFRILTPKLRIIGQGIDCERFSYHKRIYEVQTPFRIIMVGRISPIKDFETLLRATRRMYDAGEDVIVDIVGGVGLPEQEEYLTQLKELARTLEISERINFCGGIQNSALPEYLSRAHCFVNTSRTGSFDKVVGEAMATGLPILTSNEAFREVLGSHASDFMFPPGDDRVLAEKLAILMQQSDAERHRIGVLLRKLILDHHSLTNFIAKILAGYKQ